MSTPQNCYLTCAGRVDGIGAQIQATLSTMLTAKELGLIYCHSPFQEIEHYLDPESAALQWENFFSLGKDEISIKDIQPDNLKIVYIDTPIPEEILDFPNHSNTLFSVMHCHDFADKHPDQYLSIQNQILEKYRYHSKEIYASYYQPSKVNIAVHIRRGDVYRHRVNRFTDNEFYRDLLINIGSILDALQLQFSIHVYSQGLTEDFGVLNDLNLTFHLDECTYTTFYNLTSADILIMAKSSFSYAAALFSRGIKIYQPFLHQPQKDWITVGRDEKSSQVKFDRSKLQYLLELTLR